MYTKASQDMEGGGHCAPQCYRALKSPVLIGLNGNCLTNSVIYNCNVKDNDNDTGVNYIGLTEHTFKDRFYKHRNAFKYKSKANTPLNSLIISGTVKSRTII